MHEEKSSGSAPPRRSALTHTAPPPASVSPLHAVEARLSAQVAQASALAAAAAASADQQPLQPNLPTSSGTTNLRSSTASVLGAAGGSVELNPLDWADVQFKRAGVMGPGAAAGHAAHGQTPIQNLGMQQRVRHAQLFGVVEKLREGQQHIFLEQFNQFPNVESHTADDYSKIWHAFKNKDEEAQHIIAKLNGLCDHIDTLNKHANNPHA
jgi:hypothetical protein